MEPADAQAWADGACDVLTIVQRRLQGEAGVIDALAKLPVDTRSVANAVMLWDGAWRQDAASAPITSVRRAIVRSLSDAPQACLAAENFGPRLIMLHDGRGTTLLAVGSGVWRWSQLQPPPPEDFAVAK